MIIRTTPSIGASSALNKPTATFARVAASFAKMSLVAALATAVLSTTPVSAQSNVDGAISGKAPGAGSVVIEDAESGYKRTVSTSGDGSFRAASLPPGVYTVTFTDSAGTTHTAQVSVLIGTTSMADFSDDAIALGEMRISASPVNPIDFGRIESSTVLTEKQIDILPIARDVNSVALLAPGTTRGDTAFGDKGNLVSFGGSSVAENAYFVNGMNISNFRNGLDPASIPFEAYSQFETLTGAYSAQYGRSTGGVINATTKSGSNEWHGGVNLYFAPDAFAAKPPNSYFSDDWTSVPYRYNSVDYIQELEGNVYASGPLWKDKVFFYGLYNMRRVKDEDAQATLGSFDSAKEDDPFWLLKLDVVPFENHRLEYTGFRDKRTETTTTYANFDFDTHTHDSEGSKSFSFRGGDTHIGRYTGVFGDNFTVSALFGRSEQDRRTLSETDDDPLILDARFGAPVQLGGNTSATGVIESNSGDTREAIRIDLEYAFKLAGDHRLLLGYDVENNETVISSAYASPAEVGYWRYANTSGSGARVNGVDLAPNTDYARFRVLDNGGSFGVESKAFYLEDNWTLADGRLVFRLGIRNEEFKNLNANDEVFIHVKNQWAPRLGVSYDLFGDRRTKVFANFGRYHLPIASNTNARLSGAEFFTQTFYYMNGLNPDNTPILGAEIGQTNVLADGEIPDRRTIVDLDIKPMYQDEIVLGIQHKVSNDFTVGARLISRKLGTAIDDMIVDHALLNYAVRTGLGERDELEGDFLGGFHYVLGNPGRPMRTMWDIDGDGDLDELVLTPEDLEYPKAERTYYAAEIFAEKIWDGKWTAQFSYTWAHSYGNSEGWVLSDNGQDDAGITVMFDTPALTANTYGNLPNDVRHHFKLFGAYAITPELSIGAKTYLKSGRPINRLANFNDLYLGEADALAYGNDYHSIPRGTAGTTPWIFNLDLSLRWSPRSLGAFFDDRVSFQVDVFNVFNLRKATEVYEWAEEDGELGNLNPRYGIASSWQAPRSVRFSLSYEF